MHKTQKFRIEFTNGQWSILDPDNVNNRIPIDTAVVDVTFLHPNLVEGYIVSVHGLDFELAQHLSAQTLRDLGAGGPLTQRGVTMKTERGQLTPEGGVEWRR